MEDIAPLVFGKGAPLEEIAPCPDPLPPRPTCVHTCASAYFFGSFSSSCSYLGVRKKVSLSGDLLFPLQGTDERDYCYESRNLVRKTNKDTARSLGLAGPGAVLGVHRARLGEPLMFRRPAALVLVGFLFCAVRCRASLWSCLACLPVFWALPWI